jgi:hypothetical protein
MLAEKTVLNSSKSIDPEWSLNTGGEKSGVQVSQHNAHVKIVESHKVVGIRSLQKSLEDNEVVPRDQSSPGGIGDSEKNSELSLAYPRQVVLRCNSVDKIFCVQIPWVRGCQVCGVECKLWSLLFPIYSYTIGVKCAPPPLQLVIGDSYHALQARQFHGRAGICMNSRNVRGRERHGLSSRSSVYYDKF